MFSVTIDPVLAHLGPLEIRYYGLVYVIGFIIAYLVLRAAVKRKAIQHFPLERLDTYLVYLIIGTILGARIFEIIFFEPGYYFANPLQMVKIWEGGLSFHGGLFGAFVATWLFTRKSRIRFYQLADTLVIPAAIMLGIGRIANFINGELVGTITRVPWAVNFNGETDAAGKLVYRHPSQLYEALKNFLVFGILLVMKRFRTWKEGTLFWSFVLLYGVGRFITDFWRADPRFLGISMGQFLSLLMVLLAGYFLGRRMRKHRAKDF